MVDGEAIVRVVSGTVRCTGGAGRKQHAALEIVVPTGVVATCPVCGLRFQRVAGDVSIGQAMWPKEE
jgi:hypothetical protein